MKRKGEMKSPFKSMIIIAVFLIGAQNSKRPRQESDVSHFVHSEVTVICEVEFTKEVVTVSILVLINL